MLFSCSREVICFNTIPKLRANFLRTSSRSRDFIVTQSQERVTNDLEVLSLVPIQRRFSLLNGNGLLNSWSCASVVKHFKAKQTNKQFSRILILAINWIVRISRIVFGYDTRRPVSTTFVKTQLKMKSCNWEQINSTDSRPVVVCIQLDMPLRKTFTNLGNNPVYNK